MPLKTIVAVPLLSSWRHNTASSNPRGVGDTFCVSNATTLCNPCQCYPVLTWKGGWGNASGKCSMIDRFLGDAFGALSFPFWSTVLQCGAWLPIHLKYWTVQTAGARFLTGGVIECDIARRQSVAVLRMLYKIRCNLMHPLNGALPGPYVPVRVTRIALVAHRYTYAMPRCRTLQCRRTFILLSESLWNVLADPVFDGVGLAGFKSKANAFLLA